MITSNRFPMRAVAVAAALLLSACNATLNNTDAQGQTPVPAHSTKPRDTNPQVSDANLASVVNGNTQFALNAFRQFDPTNASNLAFSPYSVTQAMAMAATGANGTTLSQIEQAMAFPLPPVAQDAALNKLDLLLAADAPGTTDPQLGQLPQLSVSNAIWVQRNTALQTPYLDSLGVNFGAGVAQLDFGNAVSAAGAINNWIAQQTNNRISNLVSAQALNPSTKLMLTNAAWFKGSWAMPFSAKATANQAFYAHDGSGANVPFMNQTAILPYAQVVGAQAIDLPYSGNQLSMLVVLPDVGKFDSFTASLSGATLQAIVAKLASTNQVALAMPKFSLSGSPNVQQALGNLGVSDAFAANRADFSGIDGLHDLFINAISHQASIRVDEAGSEAAAATGVGVGTTTVPSSSLVNLMMNRPFLFFIRDHKSNAVLFMGKVVKLQ